MSASTVNTRSGIAGLRPITILDSGAYSHTSGIKTDFCGLHQLARPRFFAGIGGGLSVALYKGTQVFNIIARGRLKSLVIENVLYCPADDDGLLSCSAFADIGLVSDFDKRGARLINKENGGVVAEFERSLYSNHYELCTAGTPPKDNLSFAQPIKTNKYNISIWDYDEHERQAISKAFDALAAQSWFKASSSFWLRATPYQG